MTASSDRDGFSERLITIPRAVFRWATPAPKSRGGSSSALGCLNPVMLVKIAVGLIVIVLMPLFMLPFLLVRIATFGWTSVRYSSAIQISSGDRARWGYGTLAPVPAPHVVRAGAMAIASGDPQFNPETLTHWAVAASGLICQSLTSGDATPARTFMANGLFRTYLALLELRARAQVQCEGSWRAVSATLVGAVATPLFDEVRVRVMCEGSCWERHGPTGLTTRGSAEAATWSEDLTFGRSAGAVSPVAGGLPAKHCPSCGAPLDLDRDGACRYCQGIVTAGKHDWVLLSWRREPW